MKISIKKTIEDSVDVTLPVYRKDVCHYYKVINEHFAIQVCDLSTSKGINQVYAGTAFHNTSVECTEDEFYAKFNEILWYIRETLTLSDIVEGTYDDSDRVNRNVEASEGMER